MVFGRKPLPREEARGRNVHGKSGRPGKYPVHMRESLVDGPLRPSEGRNRSDAGSIDDRCRRAMRLGIVQEEIAFLAEAWDRDPRLDKATIHALIVELNRRGV